MKNSQESSKSIAACRKYSIVLLSLFILIGGFALITFNPTQLLVSLYENLVWGMFLTNSAYYGGNVANKWAVKKSNDLGKENGIIRERSDDNHQ